MRTLPTSLLCPLTHSNRVTRLIKASKNQKPTRDALLATSGSSSSLSFVKPEVQIGSKLAAAQGELQACEAHLAGHEYAVRKVQWSPHRADVIASASYDMTCRV